MGKERRLILILISFAAAVSLTAFAASKMTSFLPMENPVLYIIWCMAFFLLIRQLMFLLVSMLPGQFPFFKNYSVRVMGRRRAGLNLELSLLKIKSGGVRNEAITALKPVTESLSQTTKPENLAIFASGAGSNAQKIIDHFRDSPTVKIALIACNRTGAGVISIAQKENIPVLLLEKERFFRGDSYLPQLKEKDCGFIVLAGFLWKIPQTLIDAFPKKIINLHPALLPKYGGRGMYGQYVHEAVLNAGELQTGITIHYVDEHYDNGDVIFQTACPVLEGDTPETLAQRIHQLEHLHYPRVIEEVLERTADFEGS